MAVISNFLTISLQYLPLREIYNICCCAARLIEKFSKPTYSASVIPPFQTNSFSWFILSFNAGVNYTYLLSNIKIRILAVADHRLIPKFPLTLK